MPVGDADHTEAETEAAGAAAVKSAAKATAYPAAITPSLQGHSVCGGKEDTVLEDITSKVTYLLYNSFLMLNHLITA